MSTFTSIIPAAGTIPSFRQQKGNLPKGARTSLNAVRTNTTTYLTGKLARTDSSEKFIQEHLTAIFMGLYFETAMGPLVGALGMYFFNHWMT
jgi:hypothetical protein